MDIINNMVKDYTVYDYRDEVKEGDKIRIEHSIYINEADISYYTNLSIDELIKNREESAEKERNIFENLRKSMSEWEHQAITTKLLDMSIEYLKTPVVEHSSNQRQLSKGKYFTEISNMVYKMSFNIYEQTGYNAKLQKNVSVAWEVTWDVGFQCINNKHMQKIDGQYRKKFTSKEKAEKYLDGRIKKYAYLFTEISPPIPSEAANHFKVNGKLLPGYLIQSKEG